MSIKNNLSKFSDEEEKNFYFSRRLANNESSSRGFYRLNVSTGKKSLKNGAFYKSQGRASAKFDYLNREGDYVFKGGKGTSHFEYISREVDLDRPDDFITGWAGNMPDWVDSPKEFWIAADEFERLNGTLYREIQINFDNDFTKEDNIKMAKDFTKSILGNKHAYFVAYHSPKTLNKENSNPHAHIIFSERILDGIERPREQFFKRFNSANPERGGCKKETVFSNPKTNRDWLLSTRKEWADILNIYALKKGINKVFSEKSLSEQGIVHEPETRLPLSDVNRFKHGMKSESVKQLFKKRKEKEAFYKELSKDNKGSDYREDLHSSYNESYLYYLKKYQPNEAFKSFSLELSDAANKSKIEAISLMNSFMKERANIVSQLKKYAAENPFVKYENILKEHENYLFLKDNYNEKIANYDKLTKDEKSQLSKDKTQIKTIFNAARLEAYKKTKMINEQAVFARSIFEHAQKDMGQLNKIIGGFKSQVRGDQEVCFDNERFASMPSMPLIEEKLKEDFEYYLDNKEVFLERLTSYKEKFSQAELDKEITSISPNKEAEKLFKLELNNSGLVVLDGEVYVDYWDNKRSKNLGNFYTTKPYLDEKNMLSHRVNDLLDSGKIENLIQVNDDVPYPVMLNNMLNNKGKIFAINGIAGSGKTYAMRHYISIAREHNKYNNVIGTSLTGKASSSFSKTIKADEGMTIHKLENRLNNGSLWLDEKSIIVMDEAGMTGTKQMNRVLAHVNHSGASIIVLGDTKQLSSVEAGTAFKDILKTLPNEMQFDTLNVRRQRLEHHKEATSLFFNDKPTEALDIYSNEGSIHVIEKGENPQKGLSLSVDLYFENLKNNKGKLAENILLSHRNKDVIVLNDLIRERLGLHQKTGIDIKKSENENISIVPGEFVSFTKNYKMKNGIEVMNGQQGIVEEINKDGKLLIKRDQETFNLDPKEYSDIAYGYAMTIHKSQGTTVDNVVLYAGSSTGKEAGYVAFTRHRNNFDAVFNQEVFERPDISIDSEYFNRIGTLNTKEDKQLEILKNSINQKLTPKEKEQMDRKSLIDAKMIFEEKYNVNKDSQDIKQQVTKDYNSDPLSAIDRMDSYVNNLFSTAKNLTKETNGLVFMRYKTALHKQKIVSSQYEKINQLEEKMFNSPNSQNKEKLELANKQLKSIFWEDEVRRSAKKMMTSHNRHVKKELFVRDLLWQAAKNTQKEFKSFRKELDVQRLNKWQANKENQPKLINVLWRKDLVERYEKGERSTKETLSPELIEKALNAGYEKLLDIQQKENPHDKPKLWRDDLVAFEKSVLKSAKEKGFNNKEMSILNQKTREQLLNKQSRNLNLKEQAKEIIKSDDRER